MITVDEYISVVASKKDPLFDRPDMRRVLDQSPFYAIEEAPAIHHTMGGVVINSNGEVQDTE